MEKEGGAVLFLQHKFSFSGMSLHLVWIFVQRYNNAMNQWHKNSHQNYVVVPLQGAKDCCVEERKAVTKLCAWLSKLDLEESSDTDESLDAASRGLLETFRSAERSVHNRRLVNIPSLLFFSLEEIIILPYKDFFPQYWKEGIRHRT